MLAWYFPLDDLTKKIKRAPIVGSKINDDKIGKFIISPKVKLEELKILQALQKHTDIRIHFEI